MFKPIGLSMSSIHIHECNYTHMLVDSYKWPSRAWVIDRGRRERHILTEASMMVLSSWRSSHCTGKDHAKHKDL